MGALSKTRRTSLLGGCALIFVTVGTQLPFDRMVTAVDAWAKDNPSINIFAQIGPGATPPKSMEFSEFVSPTKANELMKNAELIVAHAGMGSVLTALKYQRPIIIIPRKAALGEHRNEHQLATARWLSERPGITVAWSETDLSILLNKRRTQAPGGSISEFAAGSLIEKLITYISTNR